MENSEKKTENAADFFNTDRGERAMYEGATPSDLVLLPITRDGFEALLETACKRFSPALPMDDSTRKVLSGYVHHIANETNETTLETISKVLYKSIANALTWTIDQEVKAQAQAKFAEHQAKAKAKADEEAKQAAIAKREMKQSKKSGRRVTVKQKPNESEMS